MAGTNWKSLMARAQFGRPDRVSALLRREIATLVHDDIMDGAALRRAQPTAAAKWGSALSVLLGDCLFAHALELAASGFVGGLAVASLGLGSSYSISAYGGAQARLMHVGRYTINSTGIGTTIFNKCISKIIKRNRPYTMFLSNDDNISSL